MISLGFPKGVVVVDDFSKGGGGVALPLLWPTEFSIKSHPGESLLVIKAAAHLVTYKPSPIYGERALSIKYFAHS